jgi:hypothetical protein
LRLLFVNLKKPLFSASVNPSFDPLPAVKKAEPPKLISELVEFLKLCEKGNCALI